MVVEFNGRSKYPVFRKNKFQILKERSAGKLSRDLFAKEKGQNAYETMNKYYGWIGTLGKLKKTELIESGKEGELTKRRYRFYFEDSENVIVFLYDEAGKVTGFAFL